MLFRRSISLRRALLLALLAVIAFTSPLHAAPKLPDVLNQAPAEAPMLVVIPNLGQLSRDIATLNDRLELDITDLVDVLAVVKQKAGIGRGLNDEGSLLLAITSTTAFTEGGEGGLPAVLLMPVSDYAAFVGNFGGDAAQNVTALTLPDGQEAFARRVGAYAAMAPNRQLVESYRAANAGAALAEAAGALGGETLAAADVIVYLNMPQLGPALLPMMESAAQAQMSAQGAPAQASADPAAASQRAAAAAALSASRALLRDADAVVFGLDIAELGVGLTAALQFKSGSPLATHLGSGGEAAAALTKLSPDPYMFASAMNLEGIAVRPLLEELFGGDAAAAGPMQMFLASVPLMERSKSIAQAYYVPQQTGFGVSWLNGVSVVETNDPKGYVAAFQEYLQSLDTGPAEADPLDGGAAAKVTVTTRYTPNMLDFGGASIDEYEVRYSLPAEVQGSPVGGLLAMSGLSSQRGYVAITGNYVVATTATDSELIRKALDAVRAQGRGLAASPTMQQARAQLLGKPSVETFINVTGIANTVNAFTNQMMPQFPPIPTPGDLPPIAMGLTVQEGGAAGRVFLPTAALRFVKQAVEAVQTAQQEQLAQQQDPTRPTPAAQRPQPQRPTPTGPPGRPMGPMRPGGPGGPGPMRPGGPGGPGGPMRPGGPGGRPIDEIN